MYGVSPPSGHGIQPSGGQGRPPEQAAGPSDPAFAAAVRLQRRRHRWGVAIIWLIVIFFLLAGSIQEAQQDGAPAPAWFVDLMLASAAAGVFALGVVIAYTVALGRCPAALRDQAIQSERLRIRQLSWPRRVYWTCFWTAAYLGMPLFLGGAVIGVPWVINGAAHLLGAGPVVRWAAAPPIHSDGDATVSLIVGLLFVFGGVLVAYFLYRRATGVWWPRYLRHRAEAEAISWPPQA